MVKLKIKSNPNPDVKVESKSKLESKTKTKTKSKIKQEFDSVAKTKAETVDPTKIDNSLLQYISKQNSRSEFKSQRSLSPIASSVQNPNLESNGGGQVVSPPNSNSNNRAGHVISQTNPSRSNGGGYGEHVVSQQNPENNGGGYGGQRVPHQQSGGGLEISTLWNLIYKLKSELSDVKEQLAQCEINRANDKLELEKEYQRKLYEINTICQRQVDSYRGITELVLHNYNIFN